MDGRYIYGIIGDSGEKKFASPAIGVPDVKNTTCAEVESEVSTGVYSISFQDIAAVTSPSSITKYSISRENTMAHQRVLEELMKDFTVLPVRFGTVAKNKNGVSSPERIKEEILKARYEELKELFAKMDDKIELGLKAIWCDMKAIFNEVVEENRDIKLLKEKISSKTPLQTYGERVALGEKVKIALERKKADEEKNILAPLKESYVDMRSNKIFGDNMITNCAFLTEKSKVEQFDRAVDKLSEDYTGRIKFKYIGPVPPCNFVELVITLGGEKNE